MGVYVAMDGMAMVREPEQLLQVTAPHFCAAAIWRGGRCVAAAPILAWMVGADNGRIKRWLYHKGYQWHWIKGTT